MNSLGIEWDIIIRDEITNGIVCLTPVEIQHAGKTHDATITITTGGGKYFWGVSIGSMRRANVGDADTLEEAQSNVESKAEEMLSVSNRK